MHCWVGLTVILLGRLKFGNVTIFEGKSFGKRYILGKVTQLGWLQIGNVTFETL